MKHIIVINAGPRKNWNTDSLIKEAAKGAQSSGAEIEYIDLFKLEKYTGCISCFGCKLPNNFGKCICNDGLHDVLEKVRNADGLIIGSPIYLGDLTASFHALYERLVFQSLTYNLENPCCNNHLIPVLLVATSNVSEIAYDAIGYTDTLEKYVNTLSRYVGETRLLVCGDTLQVNDYSCYNWTMFDPEAKKQHHEDSFSSYLQNAFEMGSQLV